ncbi:unnamed protein product, partial [Didymodactylos carnosus]
MAQIAAQTDASIKSYKRFIANYRFFDTDERQYCKHKYLNEKDRRYHCLNSSECISVMELCNFNRDCPLGDDEYLACCFS